MRKITAGLFMSLDGVVESPGEWGFRYANDAMWAGIVAAVAQADAVLLGRRTYENFARFWPTQDSDVPMSDFLNNTPKHVVASTRQALEWGPATLVVGDLADALNALKQQPGRNIQVPGSPTLVRSLLRDGLLDELSLNVCPIVVGSGMRLFEGMKAELRLELVDSTSFATGVVGVTYRPERA
jgi:dihydrofolate reductase